MTAQRLRRVREGMAAEGISQLIVTGRPNLFYLTGEDVNPHDRLNAAVIRPDSAQILCYNLSQVYAEGYETLVYEDSGQGGAHLARLLTPGLRTGVDAALSSRYLLGLQEALPGTPFVWSGCVEQTRCVKDEEEIRRLRRVSELTDRVFARAFPQLEEGMTELDFGDVFSAAFREEGAGYFPGHPMVAFGPGTADPHHSPGRYRLRKGDAVMADTGMQVDGYYSDMTRTAFFGSVSDEQRLVYETVLEANRAAMAEIRPGVPLRNAHEAACRVIEAAGYGGRYPHRTSHGIGIDYHEEPFDTPSRTVILEAGMCLSIEPGIYLPGRFGVRIEDLVTVTENGFSLLNHAQKGLEVYP
ncbi:MAG: aminopeptidase P family protein [Clostridia bacterium]|nr:aminopeptidase P family protein [Clostridia bacterium]